MIISAVVCGAIGIGMLLLGAGAEAEAEKFLTQGEALEGVVFETDTKVETKRGRRGRKRTETTYFLSCMVSPPGVKFDESDPTLEPWQGKITVDENVYDKYSSANRSNWMKADFVYLQDVNEWTLKEQAIEDKEDGGLLKLLGPVVLLVGIGLGVFGVMRFKKRKSAPPPMPAQYGAPPPMPPGQGNQQWTGAPGQPQQPGNYPPPPPSAGPRPMGPANRPPPPR
jgi:hypothetical protein